MSPGHRNDRQASTSEAGQIWRFSEELDVKATDARVDAELCEEAEVDAKYWPVRNICGGSNPYCHLFILWLSVSIVLSVSLFLVLRFSGLLFVSFSYSYRLTFTYLFIFSDHFSKMMSKLLKSRNLLPRKGPFKQKKNGFEPESSNSSQQKMVSYFYI